MTVAVQPVDTQGHPPAVLPIGSAERLLAAPVDTAVSALVESRHA